MKIYEGNISKKDLKTIDKELVHSNMFPWFYLQKPVTEKFPAFAHVLIPRYDYETNEGYKVNSASWEFFERIFLNFCKKNKIKVNRILRAAVNLQGYFKEDHGTPHTDHPFPHKVCIMYLNDIDRGSTYLFKEKEFINGKPTNTPAKKIAKEIKQHKGKIVVFPGENYHAAGHCGKPNQVRIIVIISFD